MSDVVNSQWPTAFCVRCQRPADKMEAWFDACRYGRWFVVRCHGQTEHHFLGDQTVANIAGFKIVGIRAFDDLEVAVAKAAGTPLPLPAPSKPGSSSA